VKASDAAIEPAFQPLAAGAARQPQDTESELAEDHRIDDELGLVSA
jgi:hypothetical protein